MPKVMRLPVSIRRNTGDSAANGDDHTKAATKPLSSNGGHFRPGRSGNPRGRPLGTSNLNHLRLRELLFEDAERVLRRVVDEAIAGNMLAARLVLDRALPTRACRPPMGVIVAPLETAADASATLARIVGLTADGAISTSEAAEMAKVIEVFNSTLVVVKLSEKVRQLEALLDEVRQ